MKEFTGQTREASAATRRMHQPAPEFAPGILPFALLRIVLKLVRSLGHRLYARIVKRPILSYGPSAVEALV